jgi:hypothetical protein
MEADSFDDLELFARIMQIAKTHNITMKQAMIFYQKQLETKIAEIQENIANYKEPPPSELKMKLGEEKYNMLIENFIKNYPTSEELSQAYYQAKTSGELKQARLKIGGKFYFNNADFIGTKILSIGTLVEANIYNDSLYQVWISPTECELVFSDELEFI